MTKCVCTIASINYTAQVLALAESVRRHEPEASFRWLIVDRRPVDGAPEVPSWMAIHWVEDLKLPDFERLAVIYDALELNTNVKPAFIASLLERFERVVYLDPDILLFAALGPVWDALAANSIVLTPHVLTPYPDEGVLDEAAFLAAGVFNLGFAAFRRSPEASKLLAWWCGKCLQAGWNAPQAGTFLDQKWVDLFPCFSSDVGILRHPGCNVAYWNQHERALADVGTPRPIARFGGAGYPLVFFHFSGFDPRRPALLSKHKKRLAISSEPLRALLSAYADRLRAHGFDRWSAVSYSYGEIAGTLVLNRTARRAAAQTRLPAYFSNPEFARWLAGMNLGLSVAQAGAERIPRRRQVRKKMLRRLLRLYLKIFGPGSYDALIAYLPKLAAPGEQGKIFPWKKNR